MLNLTSVSDIGGVIYDLSIKQGKTYQLSFYYPQDLTAGEIRGQIRDKYAQDNGVLLAEFGFTVTWDSVESKSLVVASLDASETALIAYTKFPGYGIATTRNCHVYDIEYEENGSVILLLNGLVEVKPEVTVEVV